MNPLFLYIQNLQNTPDDAHVGDEYENVGPVRSASSGSELPGKLSTGKRGIEMETRTTCNKRSGRRCSRRK